MPPKKKKTQLKPVARGFATTSVPKKTTPPPEPVEEVTETAHGTDKISNEEGGAGASVLSGNHHTTPAPVRDPEEQAAQILVEKYQEKTEKEISRYAALVSISKQSVTLYLCPRIVKVWDDALFEALLLNYF